MSEEQTVTLPDGFTPVSKTWPRYAQRVLFFRKDGTVEKGWAGDNGVYFAWCSRDPQPHKSVLGWKPVEKEVIK